MTHNESTPEQQLDNEAPRHRHVCPWWVGFLLASPLRKLAENPEAMLAPLVEPGMTIVDVGSAMGFFSLPAAKMVGDEGRVFCLDVQQKMLSSLQRRARRRGLDHLIETRLVTQDDLSVDDLAGRVDLVLAIHVVHETTYPRRFLATCLEMLSGGGRLLLVEPRGHVSEAELEATRAMACEIGLEEQGFEARPRSWRATFGKS